MDSLENAVRGASEMPSTQHIAKLNATMTDQEVIRLYYEALGERQFVVASDQFLEKSSDRYSNTDWLTREIAQNFVDHNAADPGTLNGVTVDSGRNSFTIEGPWSFENPSALISPHSDKPDSRNTAGGNGIGLKQVATIFLRDLDVSEFQVEGDGWTLNYNIVSADELNRQLVRWGVERRISTNWLCAKVDATADSQRCTYTIRTKNKSLLASLSRINEITVGDDNPFLQNPNYASDKGAIVWHEVNPEVGRLFVNGQVMAIERSNEQQDYWGSLRGVSVQVNDIKYDMSIDRAAIAPYRLGSYIRELVAGMSTDDLVEQIHNSRFLWSKYERPKYSHEEKGSMKVLEDIVSSLSWSRGYDKSTSAELFGQDLVAYDRISPEDASNLRSEGYVLCPEFFHNLGIPKASSKIDHTRKALGTKPQPSSFNARRNAKESGISVGYDSSLSFKEAVSALKNMGGVLEAGPDNTYRISFDESIDQRLHYHSLQSPVQDKIDQGIIFGIRTAVYAGLSDGSLKDPVSGADELHTTYCLNKDDVTGSMELWIRNIEGKNSNGNFIQFQTREDLPAIWGVSRDELGTYKSKPKKRRRRKGGFGKALLRVGATVCGIAAVGAAIYGASQIEIPHSNNPPVVMNDAPELPEPKKAKAENKDTITDVVRFELGKTDSPYAAPKRESKVELNQVVSDYEKARIAGKRSGHAYTNPPSSGDDHVVEDFQIVTNPTEAELKQLEVLSKSVEYATGYVTPNRVFIFTGRGAKGINTASDDIGIHREMLSVGFQEAYNVYTHELAHNMHGIHDHNFARAQSALLGSTNETLMGIAQKQARRKKLSRSEKYLLTTPGQWNKLQKE